MVRRFDPFEAETQDSNSSNSNKREVLYSRPNLSSSSSKEWMEVRVLQMYRNEAPFFMHTEQFTPEIDENKERKYEYI